ADKNYVGTAKLGSVDRVIDMDAGRYKLSVGGWVSRENVRPLEGSASVQNLVSRVSFEQENGAEVYHFAGTSQPVAGAYRTGSQLIVELPHTTGISSVPTGKSSLFSSVSVTEKADSLLLTFELKPSAILWGYVVEYADGVTSLVCKYKPRLSGSADRPLEGIVVALDSGHGSADPGALGLAQLTGPTEAEINRATALATKKRLESLGATVYLPEQLDLNSRFNERMQPAISYRADLFISLHCNSIVDNANGLTPNGTEIYYFEAPGKALGDALLPQILSATGRAGRGVKWNAFRVTLNTLAPSVLIEMGFMTNPIDYDSLCSRQGVYQMANAVGDGIVALLS
ncbi:MAG: N-acetylmuramoyl-L-alanine amidase, partial [Oscillospiraceae bacterium]